MSCKVRTPVSSVFNKVLFEIRDRIANHLPMEFMRLTGNFDRGIPAPRRKMKPQNMTRNSFPRYVHGTPTHRHSSIKVRGRGGGGGSNIKIFNLEEYI